MQKIEILDTDRVLRRVQFLNPDFIKPDGKPASSSYTLKKNADGTLEEGLSVDLESLTSYAASIQDVNRFRLFVLEVQFIRNLGLNCVHNPLDHNFSHSLICGEFKKSISRELAANSQRIRFPD